MDSVSNMANGTVAQKYESFIQTFKNKKEKLEAVNLNEYNSYIDTLTTSLSFLKKLGSDGKAALPMEKLNELKDKFNQSAKVNEFINERKQHLQQLLSQYTKLPPSIKKQYDKMRKTAYYYKAQVNECKSMLKDPKKIEETAIMALNKIPAFQKFMKQNGQLAYLFHLHNNQTTAQSLASLQTRTNVQGLLQQRIRAGGPNAMQIIRQNITQATSELDKLKDKINQLGGNGSDFQIPDFKPNSQKVKSIFKRLQFSSDVQFAKENNFIPSTSNISLGIGYKLNDRSITGIAMSYKLGMGSLQYLQFRSEGLGLRSYIDLKIKKQIYFSGGYELNYYSAFKNIAQLEKYNMWQKSALIGISKRYRISKKVGGELKLLYDFLAYRHTPASPPFLFRTGYTFK
jgi:hypothetical protein